MLQVDVLSAYVICGAGSLVGAAMMRLTESNDPRTRQALDIAMAGFLLLGLALGGVYFAGAAPGLLQQGFIAAGTVGSMVLFTSGLGQLSGAQALSKTHTAALLGLSALLGLIGPLAGAAALTHALALALAAASAQMATKSRRFILRPRDAAERALGVSVLALAVSTWVRAGLTFTTEGEPAPHLLHMPAWLLSPFAVLYGMLPILVATLLLSLVNARLRKTLSVRAATDELTGALTRRALRELAPAMIEARSASNECLAVLMLDLDHFKTINDQFGHASGDVVLQGASEALRAQLRPDAMLARYGGEEFVVLAPVPDLRVARQVAERMREAVATSKWQATDGRTMAVTLSVGVALIGERETLDAALQRADEALYRAKHDGRNQVQVALVAA